MINNYQENAWRNPDKQCNLNSFESAINREIEITKNIIFDTEWNDSNYKGLQDLLEVLRDYEQAKKLIKAHKRSLI